MDDVSALIQRYCRDADQAAFRAFYRAHATKLWKFLVARGCDSESAYDLLAEAFLRFIRAVCRDPRAPVALLYRIALNLRIDAFRRQKASLADPVADPDELAATVPDNLDDHAHVRALVQSLPASEQNLLLLRYWIGLSHKEVAQALDLPEGTVRRRCSEALEKIRQRWEGDQDKHATG